jgi:predicted dehydrogenase
MNYSGQYFTLALVATTAAAQTSISKENKSCLQLLTVSSGQGEDNVINTHVENTSSVSNHSKTRYAIVGLGAFAQSDVLPAFAEAENSELIALVSGDASKCDELSHKYGVRQTCSYEEYDDLLKSGNIDAVYLAMPNHLHCDYTVRAAKAGIHVLCEKPMAVTVEDCQAMIEAARDNNIKLMIAYRLHLEPANLQAVEIVQSGQLGEPRIFTSLFTQQTYEGDIRLDKEIGEGTLDDIGIYCINAARYIFQSEPIAVFATTANNDEKRFREVAEMTSVIMLFPDDRLATFTCSFGAVRIQTYQVVGTKGDLQVNLAYSTQGPIKHILTIDGAAEERSFEPYNQVVAELLYFSDCIVQNQEPEPSGTEGLIDIQIIRALYQSIETGRFVELDGLGNHSN